MGRVTGRMLYGGEFSDSTGPIFTPVDGGGATRRRSRGRHDVANGRVSPPIDACENWARGVTGFPPPTFRYSHALFDAEMLAAESAVETVAVVARRRVLPTRQRCQQTSPVNNRQSQQGNRR